MEIVWCSSVTLGKDRLTDKGKTLGLRQWRRQVFVMSSLPTPMDYCKMFNLNILQKCIKLYRIVKRYFRLKINVDLDLD